MIVEHNADQKIIFQQSHDLSRSFPKNMEYRESVINSADAGATRVRVLNDRKNPGKIVVEDNGEGFDDKGHFNERTALFAAGKTDDGHFNVGIKAAALALLNQNLDDIDPDHEIMVFITQGKYRAFRQGLMKYKNNIQELPYDKKLGSGTTVMLNGPSKGAVLRKAHTRDTEALQFLNGRFWTPLRNKYGKSMEVQAEAPSQEMGKMTSVKGLKHYLELDGFQFTKAVKSGAFSIQTVSLDIKHQKGKKKNADLGRFTTYSRSELSGKVLVVHDNEVYAWGNGIAANPAELFGVKIIDAVVIVTVDSECQDLFRPDRTRQELLQKVPNSTQLEKLSLVGASADYRKNMPSEIIALMRACGEQKLTERKANREIYENQKALRFFSGAYAKASQQLGSTIKKVKETLEEWVIEDTRKKVGGTTQPALTFRPEGPHYPPTTKRKKPTYSTTNKGKAKRLMEALTIPEVEVYPMDKPDQKIAVWWQGPNQEPYAPNEHNLIEIGLNTSSYDVVKQIEMIQQDYRDLKEKVPTKEEIIYRMKVAVTQGVLFSFLKFKETGDHSGLSSPALTGLIANPHVNRPKRMRDLEVNVVC
jgi:hypothetical protein